MFCVQSSLVQQLKPSQAYLAHTGIQHPCLLLIQSARHLLQSPPTTAILITPALSIYLVPISFSGRGRAFQTTPVACSEGVREGAARASTGTHEHDYVTETCIYRARLRDMSGIARLQARTLTPVSHRALSKDQPQPQSENERALKHTERQRARSTPQ